ncbi:hypothetical protein GWI33_020100 [Rhynchophorus ferrugineus]|uniref:Uncharacterized protein n=1 Tax=Rhynchophorus ferrugineus TaxID=354439 RepID=A0A834M4K5_RHYFE|nr:hypothetical protein GWI33_020100 [Rhynchophorus ferrugineus]
MNVVLVSGTCEGVTTRPSFIDYPGGSGTAEGAAVGVVNDSATPPAAKAVGIWQARAPRHLTDSRWRAAPT